MSKPKVYNFVDKLIILFFIVSCNSTRPQHTTIDLQSQSLWLLGHHYILCEHKMKSLRMYHNELRNCQPYGKFRFS